MPQDKKIFHFKVTWANILGVCLIIFIAGNFLWKPSSLNVIIGLILLVLSSIMIDRILRTKYMISSDNFLIIYRGHIAKQKKINIEEIIRIKKIKTIFPSISYIFIEYGLKGKHIAIQIENQDSFIREITIRQTQV